MSCGPVPDRTAARRRSVPRRGVRLALAAGVLLAAACGGAERPDRPEVGRPAPAYEGATLGGDTLRLEELRGRPVLLNLWATWCVPCRTETPYLQSLAERYAADGLEVVGVSVDNRTAGADVRAFVEEFGVTYTVIHDPEGRALDVFSAVGLPATYLLDRSGVVRFVRIGPVHEGEEAFESVLAEVVGEGAES